MTPYSTRQLATLLEVRPERIRALARRAEVTPARDERGRLHFSFQDLVLLRTANDLARDAACPRRVWRALRSLGRQLRDGTPLSAIRMRIEGGRLLATSAQTTWVPESGQTLFDFARAGAPPKVEALSPRAAARAVRQQPTAEEWFELGIALEQSGAEADAEAAYRQAFTTDPAHVDARINLGRLRHAAQALDEAESLYREALGLEPTHAVACFNLGVVLEDHGRLEDAAASYERALGLDPELAEAHYNLARLCELAGDERAALRHLASYRRLKRS